jgi:two-component system LytT family sensor kinase
MAEQRSRKRREGIFRELILPAAGGGLAVAYATGRWDLTAVATGLAIAGTLTLSWRLHRVLLEPWLRRVEKDWLQLGLEMTFSMIEHVAGALLALLICGRLFGFRVELSVGWIVVGGVVLGFPVVHGTEMALRYYRQLREKELAEQRLRALATEAELKALKAQINPHFLFNTLNTIAQLIHTDPAQAEATVERLAEMFRYVLSRSERGLVPLEEELAFVDGYLEIERARFGERLRVVREVAPEALSVPVPSLILQPLVENAVHHGRGEDGSVDLSIRVAHHGNVIAIAIADRGPGMAPRRAEGGHGHGLRNVDERLRKTCGPAFGLQIEHDGPRGTVVTVRVPVGA